MRLTIGIPCAMFSDNLCMISVDGKMNDNNERGDSKQKIERIVGEPEYLVGKVSSIHRFGTSLRWTFTQHNFTLRIGYTPRCQPDIRWPHALILHLYVVVENGGREHDLKLASYEVASRTGMTPVSERQELRAVATISCFLLSC